MSDAPSPLVRAALSRLVGDDPLAADLLSLAAATHPTSFAVHAALALVREPFERALGDARALATTRRERQHLAVVDAWLSGDRRRSRLLAREHLAEFPDDVVVSWLVARAVPPEG